MLISVSPFDDCSVVGGSSNAAMLYACLRVENDPDPLVAPVYGWFTEGFDTLDLKEAKALLGQLSAI